ncbi:MAG: hypothetical protein U9Q62_00610 [Campylobacterota bacterium]|nr:hypothetical protein [Campylobacterota bacterium]
MYRRSLILSALLLIMSGCTVSTLSMPDQEKIVIAYDAKKIDIDGEVVKSNDINLQPAMIYQSVFKVEEGDCIVYETTDLDIDYRYNHGTSRTIDIIFDAKRVKTHFTFNNLSFLQVELKNSQTVNVLVHQSNDEYLTFAYGFSTSEFQKMIDTINADGGSKVKPLKRDVITFSDPDKAIISQWRAEMLVIDVIFAPLRRMMMR